MAETDKSAATRRSKLIISTNVLVQVLAVLALVVMVNWLASRHYTRFDWTRSGYYKISDKTRQVLSTLREPLQVIVYLQPYTESEADERIFQDVRNLLKEFKFIARDKLQIEYVDPYRDMARARQLVEQYKFDVREPALVIFAQGNRNKYVSRDEMVEWEAGGFGMPARLKSFKAEGAFLSAIQTVLEGEPPTVYFLTGHGERDPDSQDQRRGLSTLATYVRRDNLRVERWNLQDQQTLPTNAAAIVVAGPRKPFTTTELTGLDEYLRNRGRLMILLDPRTQSGLEDFLQKWGVQADNNLILRKAGTLLGTELIDVNAVAATYGPHPITRQLTDINTEFPYARSVRRAPAPPANLRVTELAFSGVRFWGESDPDAPTAVFDPADGDLAGPLPLAVAVESSQPQGVDVDLGSTRLIVIGTGAFVDNSSLTAGNLDFFMSCLNWLLQREQLLAVGPKQFDEFRLDMSPGEVKAVYALTLLGLPLAVGIIGLAVWLRRRN